MIIFQQHTSKNQKQVPEYEKVMQSGSQGTAPSHGGPRKQDPTSRTAGEEGESIYHFEIQLPSLFTERVWCNKTETVNMSRLCVGDLNTRRMNKKGVSLKMKCISWMGADRQTLHIQMNTRLLRSNWASSEVIKELSGWLKGKNKGCFYATWDGTAGNGESIVLISIYWIWHF